ncbi:isatin hydrolase-like [Ostrea edulis]|uniref:isatin hydrolase-like n=1 Tax=Ostrea edulis TaxID=37623 RepID=UPI0024AF1D5B|nr:isatin hydrolase-like [Ostrea edulis]XP_056000495.1 isatin hydrolase-like [Ostrea edulis]
MDLLMICCCVFLLTVSPAYSKPRIVDLTHNQDEHSVTWPINPAYNFTVLHRGYSKMFDGWLENNYFAMPEHMGTHIDAPVHFAKGSWRTHQIPMEKLYGPGVIINVKSKVENNPDYRVSTDDLYAWEEKYGEIPRHAVVVMNSGWSHKYPDPKLVYGTSQPNDSSTFHFPSWHEEAVTWLITKRQVNAVGVDTPSTDYGQTKTFPCHIILGEHNIVGIEHVANLDNIPESGSVVYIPVIKIFDGSGGPTRLFGTYDDELNKTNYAMHVMSASVYIYLLQIITIFVYQFGI